MLPNNLSQKKKTCYLTKTNLFDIDGNRWHIEMPGIMEGSILIMSKAGTGTAMFNMGMFICYMLMQISIYLC